MSSAHASVYVISSGMSAQRRCLSNHAHVSRVYFWAQVRAVRTCAGAYEMRAFFAKPCLAHKITCKDSYSHAAAHLHAHTFTRTITHARAGLSMYLLDSQLVSRIHRSLQTMDLKTALIRLFDQTNSKHPSHNQVSFIFVHLTRITQMILK